MSESALLGDLQVLARVHDFLITRTLKNVNRAYTGRFGPRLLGSNTGT
jgi:hypothetical protein